MKRYKIIYAASISFACIYSFIILVVNSIDYEKPEVYKQNDVLHYLLYLAYTCKFIFEMAIIVVFIKSVWELLSIKYNRSKLTLK
jgi:hypothetical protein